MGQNTRREYVIRIPRYRRYFINIPRYRRRRMERHSDFAQHMRSFANPD
jgi:hypothetical protein